MRSTPQSLSCSTWHRRVCDMPLKRYGVTWGGGEGPLLTELSDGYWTPWHIAEEELAQLRAYRDSNLQLGLDIGQILGSEYDGVDLREVARELIATKALLKHQEAAASGEARHHPQCDPGWGPRNYRCHPNCPVGRA